MFPLTASPREQSRRNAACGRYSEAGLAQPSKFSKRNVAENLANGKSTAVGDLGSKHRLMRGAMEHQVTETMSVQKTYKS